MTKVIPPTGDVPAPTCREILRSVHQADVIYVAFPRFGRALVVDLRRSEADFPAMLVTKLELTAEQQAAAVERLRPGSPALHRFASVAWGGSTRAFAEQGVLPAILNRLPAANTQDAMDIFEELRDAERTTTTRTPHLAR
jgi:hypothetical protein